MNQMNMHVPLNPVGVGSNVSMQMPVPGAMMQQPSPQQIQPAMQQQPQQDKLDNISKVKSLMGSLRESIPRTAITCIQQAQSAAHYLPLTVIPSRLDSAPTTQVYI
ncbi:Mediator of RNA polymerase II transcription subunit 29 [Eumeta japonica]|uniref:Mediator of RNA polymerase II transcription subunit 29 n=1 Tax=Eumeta variegata TaxID=151549 RepID=A0A4C1XBV8_EUMVA|nr:Mediator of RNA polymerase II transcription subunit 29 [Eumeta japonica]